MLKGTVSGVVQLKTIVDYNGGNILYDTNNCYGCFVVTRGPMTITDMKGLFSLAGLSAGTYSINVDYETCITGLHDAYRSPDFNITAAQGNYRLPSVPARNRHFRLTFTKSGYSIGVLDDVIIFKDLETPLSKVTLEAET